jgi:hypothetical protein
LRPIDFAPGHFADLGTALACRQHEPEGAPKRTEGAASLPNGVERGECNLLAPLLGNGIKHRPKGSDRLVDNALHADTSDMSMPMTSGSAPAAFRLRYFLKVGAVACGEDDRGIVACQPDCGGMADALATDM